MADDPQHRYLGDGVYASFDGQHIWLRTGSHTSKPLVALEHEVVEALIEYRRDVYARAAAKREGGA